MMKRNIIRLILVVVLIALGFGLYVLGKEHKIFVDNRDIVIDGRVEINQSFIVSVTMSIFKRLVREREKSLIRQDHGIR